MLAFLVGVQELARQYVFWVEQLKERRRIRMEIAKMKGGRP